MMAGKSGGKAPYRKGRAGEQEFARLTGGRRVPLSGAAGGDFSGDVEWLGLVWQIKREREGWRTLYKLLETHDALAVRADRRPWLVILPLATFQRLIGQDHEGGLRGEHDA